MAVLVQISCHMFDRVTCLWMYSHPYSPASRRTGATSDGGRQVEQVGGNGRRRPTAVLIFARQGHI